MILKFFLNVGKDEQKARFLSRTTEKKIGNLILAI